MHLSRNARCCNTKEGNSADSEASIRKSSRLQMPEVHCIQDESDAMLKAIVAQGAGGLVVIVAYALTI